VFPPAINSVLLLLLLLCGGVVTMDGLLHLEYKAGLLERPLAVEVGSFGWLCCAFCTF
jgi:hypothetical protein